VKKSQDNDDITCFGAISLIPPSPYSPLRVRAPSTKWENSCFDGALSSRARPMRTSSQFAPQTRELPRTTIRSSTPPCRFSLSKEGVERRAMCRQYRRVWWLPQLWHKHHVPR